MTKSQESPQHILEKATVKAEILEELRKKDSLKTEVLKELQPTDWLSSFSRFVQHPVVLLFLGFLLTSGVGAGVTYLWQKRERIEGQRSAAHKVEMAKKHEIAENILKSVAETNTAVEDLVLLYFNSEPDTTIRDQMEAERLRYWQKTSRDWRMITKILQQQLKDHFRNQRAQSLFQDVLTKRFDIGQNLATHRSKIKNWKWQVPDAEKESFRKELRDTLTLKEAMLTDMRDLIAMLTQEIKDDENQ